jgi:hypothetical protein
MREAVETPHEEFAPPTEEAMKSRHGTIDGIPYDTRKPTMARVKWTYWSAENPKFFPPKVTGLGWGINFYWVIHPLRWRKVRKSNPSSPVV